jgi:epoxyqueuosine reductase
VAALADRVREAALALGFARVGFSPVEPFVRGSAALADWLAAGRHGEMAYMAQHPGRATPTSLLAEAKTLIVVALPYAREVGTLQPLHGRVARYALGADYHAAMKAKLYALADTIGRLAARPVLARPCVDSAPILEREAAERAGVGFIAKSTMSIAPGLGSYFFLGELLVDLDIEPSTPERSRCGSCERCITACPTGAIVDAQVLDARRCISYLTIEHRGMIDRALRPLIGTWVYGCDICQEVCPFNASQQPRPVAPEMQPRFTSLDLIALLQNRSSGHKKLTQASAMRRVSREQLARNAAIALGNLGDPSAIDPLLQTLHEDRSAVVRAHAAWALSCLGAHDALRDTLAHETSELVCQEITLACQ